MLPATTFPAGIYNPTGILSAQEPSVASAGRVVMYAFNWDAGYSVDGGQTFTELDPHETFPHKGVNFGCDQVVAYDPTTKRFIWVLQYFGSEGENLIRVAFASVGNLVRYGTHAWSWFDLPSGQLAGAGHFLDQPRLGFTDRNIYMNINQADDKGIHETVIVRVPRAGFENPQGPGGYGYALLEPASLRVAQNVSGPTEYFVGHKDTSTLRIASIEDNSNYLQFQDVSEPTIADHNWTMKTPGGQDVLGRQARSQQTGVTGVTQDGDGNLWAAWSEGREVEDKKGNTFIPAGQPTQPHIAVAILSVKPGQPPAITLKKRYVYWNASYALALPDLATDANGEVAMVFDWGGGTEYLNHAVAFLSGGLVDRTVAFGTTDQTTTGEPSDNNFGNPAGDYQTVRPIAPPHGGCLVAAGDVNQGEHVGYPVFTVFSRPGLACPTHFFPLPPPAGPALPPRLEGTALALSCPSEVNAGQTYTIGGTLSPTIAAAPIRITYTSSAPGTETVSHTVSTDSSGAFSDQAPGSPVGTETVDATYPGNQSFGAAEQKCSVAVHELIP